MRSHSFSLRKKLALSALIAGCFAVATPKSHAANYYWDIDGITAGSGGATPSGSWATNGTTWSTGINGDVATSAFTTTTLDDLFFSAGADATGAYAITLGANQSAKSLTFEEGTPTLSANTITLGGGGGITVLAGSGDPIISSGLTINGNNTFNIGAGRTLTLDTGAFTRGTRAALNIQGPGTVTSTKTGLAVGGLVNGIIGPWASIGTGSGTQYATFTGNNITALTGTAAATAANVTDTTGAFNYDVAAIGTLGTGANINTLRYTGAAGTIAGGLTTKGIMNAGSGLLTFSGAVTSGAAGTEIVVNAASNGITFSGILTGTLTKTGSGTVTLGNVAHTGTTIPNWTVNEGILQMNSSTSDTFVSGTINSGGTMRFGASNRFNNSAAITVNAGGTFNLNNFTDTIGRIAGAGLVTNTGATTQSLALSSGTATFSGVVSGNLNIVVNGAAQTLSGANTYTGTTSIRSSTLSINTIKNVGVNSAIGAPALANATIAMGLGTGTGTLLYTGTGDSTDRVLNLNGANGGAVLNQSGTGLLKFSSPLTATVAGTKTLTLTGSTAGTGEISGAIVDNGSVGTTALAVALTTTATNTITLGSVSGISVGAGISGAGITAGTTITAINATTNVVTLSANTDATAQAVGTTMTVAGVTNTTGLTKSGTGTWSLTGANTYTGPTTINAGTLDLGGGTANGSLASTTTLALNGGTFAFTRTGANIQGFASTRINTFTGTLSLAAGNTLNLGTVTRGVGGYDFSTIVSGTVAADTTSNANGIMSGFTFGSNTWAVANGPGVAISGLGSYTLTSVAGTTAANYTNNNIDVDNSAGLLSGAINTNSLRFNTAAATTVTLTGTPNVISSSGILVTSSVGTNLSTITGGELTGGANQDLTVIQNNPTGGLTISSAIVNNTATSLSKTGPGLLTLAGANTYTGNTTVHGGTLNITGSITGDGTTTNLVYGNSVGNTIVNISGSGSINNYKNFQGANVAGSIAVMNQTGGTTSTLGTGGNDTQWVAQNGGYGYLNITGGTFNTGRFDAVGATGGGTAVVYVGGTGIFNNNSSDWLILPRRDGTGQLTVGPGGSLVRTSAVTAPLGITMDGANSHGALNIAGGNVDTGLQGIQFGFGTSAASTGNRGFVNLAGGTLSVGSAIVQANTTAGASYFDHFNFAGGTLKSNADITLLPASSAAQHTLTATIYGPVTNNNNANAAFNTQIGTTSNFSGGLTVDTNSFAMTIASPLSGATGVGVTQADIGNVSLLAGNSGYVGAPAVVFSAPASPTGVPASGYAVLDNGVVSGIVITNPGVYAAGETPSITLTGGGGTISPFNTTALATANIAGSLTKVGTGNLILTATNTYGGVTNVNAGALIGGVPASLPGYGNPGQIVVASGAIIGGRVGGTGFTEANIATLASNATIPSTAYLGISTQNGNYTYTTAIGGNYGLAKLEANTLTIDQANTYTGGTLITGGILQLGSGGAAGDLSTGPISIAAGGALAFNRSDAYTPNMGNVITGAGALMLVNTTGSLAPAFDNQFNMTGTLTFGNAANSATSGNLNLTNSSATFGGLLSQTNLATANTITIGTGKTLTINGNVDMTNNVDGANNIVTITGGGALNVTGATISVGRNTGGTNITSKATLDLSGLSSFAAILSGNLTVQQQGDNNNDDLAKLLLANNSTITAANVIVGGSSTGAGNNTTAPNLLALGAGTNIINTGLVHLGSGSRDSGNVQFNGTTGSITLRNVAGTGRANMSMGPNGTQGTAYTVKNLFDTTGHNADLAIGTFTTALGAKTAANTHDLKFNSGTLDILTINMAVAKGTGASTSKIEIGGGTAFLGGSAAFTDTGTGSVTLATQGTGELAITGGTVTSSVSINRGTATAGSNAILTLNGGTLNMSNNSIGTAALPIDNINLQSGTLSNVAQINGGAAISKTTLGTLTLTGTNTYTGVTTVSAGLLVVNGSTTSNTNILANATLGGIGTITGNVSGPGNIAPGNSIGTLNVIGDYNVTGLQQFELAAGAGSLAASDKVLGINALTYGGTLQVSAASGTFAAGDSWDLFGFASQGGLFANNAVFGTSGDGVNLPTLTGGDVWNFDYTSGVLSIQAIPEPSTLVLGGLALLGLAGAGLRRRRMKQQA